MSGIAAAAGTRRLPRTSFGPWAPVLLLGPSLLFATVFFVVPLAVLIGNSLTLDGDEASYFTLANYVDILTDEYYWSILLRTVRVSFLTTLCALVLGYPAALYLFFSESRWRRVFLLIVVSPLFVSVIVRTYGWIVLLMPNGAIGSLLPGAWNVRLLNTEGAIVLGLMHIYMPFMVLALNSALYRVDKRLLRAAISLGASSWQVFRDILLPLSLQGILSGCIIVFSISMTAFSTPVLLGGTINKTMPYLVYQQNLLLANWHLGSALALFLLCVTLTIVGLMSRLTRVKWEAAQK